LFPNKAPKGWKNKDKDDKDDKDKDPPKEKSAKDTRDDNVDVLYSKMSDESLESLNDIEMDFDIDIDINNIQVNITSHTPLDNITNNKADSVNNFVFTSNNNNIIIKSNSRFALDTAATKHIICNKAFFTDFKECNKVVNWGEAKSINIRGIGNVYIKFKDFNKAFLLKNCLYMPKLGINLISQSEISNNYYTIFTKDNVYLKNKQNVTITKGNKVNGLYYLDIIPNNKERIFTITDAYDSNMNKDLIINKSNNINKLTLYQRFGHISSNYLDKIINNTNGFNNISSSDTINKEILECEICNRGKFTNKINRLSSNKEFDMLEKITSDLCGPINPNTYDKYKYFITFLDKKTRFLEIKLLRTKDEAYSAFIEFKEREENNKDNKRIRIYATNNGTEFINNKFKSYLINYGINH
jgi:hypothetical protein